MRHKFDPELLKVFMRVMAIPAGEGAVAAAAGRPVGDGAVGGVGARRGGPRARAPGRTRMDRHAEAVPPCIGLREPAALRSAADRLGAPSRLLADVPRSRGGGWRFGRARAAGGLHSPARSASLHGRSSDSIAERRSPGIGASHRTAFPVLGCGKTSLQAWSACRPRSAWTALTRASPFGVPP